MFKKLQIVTLLTLLCAGCDINAQQQRAEDARREATAAQLKQLGEQRHNTESPAAQTNDAQQGSTDTP